LRLRFHQQVCLHFSCGPRIDSIRQKLQRADAVTTESGEQAVGIRPAGTDKFGHAPADRVAVWQQIVEHVNDGRADIAVLAKRQ
jgi:hypothetical protein